MKEYSSKHGCRFLSCKICLKNTFGNSKLELQVDNSYDSLANYDLKITIITLISKDIKINLMEKNLFPILMNICEKLSYPLFISLFACSTSDFPLSTTPEISPLSNTLSPPSLYFLSLDLSTLSPHSVFFFSLSCFSFLFLSSLFSLLLYPLSHSPLSLLFLLSFSLSFTFSLSLLTKHLLRHYTEWKPE